MTSPIALGEPSTGSAEWVANLEARLLMLLRDHAPAVAGRIAQTSAMLVRHGLESFFSSLKNERIK